MEEKKSFKEWMSQNLVLTLICALVLGAIIGVGIMYFAFGSGRVASVKGGTLTSKELFKKMESYYSINLVLEDIDKIIVDKKYKLSDEEIAEVKKQANQIIAQYSGYGLTEEAFLQENGFDSYESFLDYLFTDYKRSIYVYDYIEKQLEENAVQNYYNDNAIDKVNTKHILVQTSEDMSDEEAQKIAKEIISRLDAGESFDDLAKEYVEKYEDKVITEELGLMGAFDNLEQGYIDGMEKLNKDEYSKEPVKTSFGYHIIYCIDKQEKTNEISVKDRMSIIRTLGKDIIENDPNIYNKALIQMREEAGLKIYDKELKEKYEEYCTENTDSE